MSESSSTQISENIRQARTLRGIPPDAYLVPYHSIADLLDRQANAAPDKVFLFYHNDDAGQQNEWSYRQLNCRVNQVANLLRDQYGIRRGDRVATLAFNHPDAVIAYFACWKLGAVATPQNADEDDNRIAFIFQDAGCRVLLAAPEYAERGTALKARTSSLEHVTAMDADYQARLDKISEAFTPTVEHMLEHPALLVYTSGTTGVPKGVMLSQYNLLSDCKGVAEWQGLTADIRMMCVLPVHHVNGLCVTLVVPLYVGGSVVLNRSFKSSTFWRRLAERKVNIVSVVPTILQFLCEAAEDITKLDLSHLSHILCGAGTMSISLVTRFSDQFQQKIVHGYGLSETTAFACLSPVDLANEKHRHWLTRYGYPSIGAEININEIAIHDGDDHELPAGEKGEIVLRGHNVMLGYFNRDDANLDAFKNGWFHSGDEGFFQVDDMGRKFLFITGRIKELINRGGAKYSPFEIEEILQSIPGVKVGLAIAFENEWYGEEVGAYVVKDEGVALTEYDVLVACRASMPFAKSPKVVKFGSDVPLTTTGKYQRLKLRDLFAAYRDVQFKEDKPLRSGNRS